ncbi:MAG TPA: hypothetical protein VN032_08560 [Thermoanaerobaculia bacterium]|nr:hypothetical protein [Thermoanaerobaculia bacterium]
MIVFESAAAPAVRPGEALVAGRRLAGRLFPYGADAGEAPLRFDPVDHRFVFRRPDAAVMVGPWEVEPWTAALGRVASGPVLVGPCSSAESVRGAYRAAAAAAVASGRPAYLLDPEADGIPPAAGDAIVALCSWKPGRPALAFPGLGAAREAGLAAAALFPLLPGWTAEAGELEALAAAAKAGGAVSLTAVPPALDGEGRRGIVEARAATDPPGTDVFFDLVHHGGWSDRMAERLAAARAAAARHGLALLPPRPVGKGERRGNAAAASRLEEMAEEHEAEEHRAALLHAAVRWLDDSARDLAAVAREGNFRKVFPFGADIADAAEAALRTAR